ncbi:Alpha/Beta hydrolase protein [Kockovaella imperatae]|uniref:Alpha/Beta hydrolase protein n=1 Tax=Kockovaella imperatae TaxID=4999 RepID=A0A1Y1UAR2_9TREE|nr:Alpha/Beta hydrolase protein [Kockovaella imperatae]ORX34597.1 Alpha/Beta hydrolase protein [Kockovaella imperatae]
MRLNSRGTIPEPDREGYLTWYPSAFPDTLVETWYRINGSLGQAGTSSGARAPVVVLHGGPGACHNYLLDYLELLGSGRAIIMYDQVGCGRSTRLEDDTYADLWVKETFVEELHRLIRCLGLSQVALLGQSWGGDLAMSYASAYPEHVTSLVVSSGLNSGKDAAQACIGRVAELPAEHQSAIERAIATSEYESEDYTKASQEYYDRFVVDDNTAPDHVKFSFQQLSSHVYRRMWGQSEFAADGNLLRTHIENIWRITCPTLVIYGSQDELAANQPRLYAALTGCKEKHMVVIQGGKHLTWLDDPDGYFRKGH